MKKEKVLILVYFLLINSIISQNKKRFDSFIETEIEKLESKGIDKLGYVRIKCSTSDFKDPSFTYLFWKKNKSIFVRKHIAYRNSNKNPSIYFKKMKIKNSVFFDFYKDHKEELNNENFESAFVMISHSCWTSYLMKFNGEELIKNFKNYDLKNEENKKTKLFQWNQKVAQFVKKLNSENKFKQKK